MAASSPPDRAAPPPTGVSWRQTEQTSAVREARAARARPERIADRYVVEEELGRGGIAVVYCVSDTVGDRRLALKQLAIASTHRSYREHAAAFEREFHTLVQLSHPRIIQVYDYGRDEHGQYYTMELLDGGDLRERSPLPWRQACALMYDVCSSLALLHSRRMVHRDISPRNVRSTLDGAAKLIDFGALSPMGPITHIIGTPPFVAPEVVHRSTLDGRTDLFSLGATLYYTLTGHLAYPARSLASLQEVWQVRPPPPSAIVPEVPAALDALVLSLISLDPAARPRGAFEVMQRLSSIAGLERHEDTAVSQAYLAAPIVVGRDAALSQLGAYIERALGGRGGGVLIEGAAGMGRSRLLDECAVKAKVAGGAVLRVNAATVQSDGPLALGYSLAEQILETMPDLAAAAAREEGVSAVLFDGTGEQPDARLSLERPAAASPERSAFQVALSRWLLRVARDRSLAILIDDAHRADQASLALLATLSLSAPRLRLLLLATVERSAAIEDAEAFAVLRRECARLELGPLGSEETLALVISLFGDVPNAALVAGRVHQAASGNPRETMDLLQSLIGQDTIRYRDGRWLLPGRLAAAELPSSAAEACRAGVASLSELARTLAEVHALASHPTLTRNDYALAAPEVSAADLDAAISELLARRVLASDGRAYSLSRDEWSDTLTAGLETDARRDRHRRLAGLYAQHEQLALERADHLLAAGDEPAGVDLLVGLLGKVAGDSQGLLGATRMTPEQVASLLDRGLTSAERLQRKPRELHEIRRALIAISVTTDEAHYLRAAPAWFAQLEHDSGLALYASLSDIDDHAARLTRALTLAAERYAATPEDERVWSPEAAIRGLGYHAAVSIAIGSRMQDTGLLASLPAMLEPFAGLSPVLHALWQNAIATREAACDNQPERAYRRWQQVLDALSQLSADQLSYVAALRGAIIFGIGSIEARMGFPSVEQTARRLDDDPLQAVSAMSLRKIARLHKGDFAGAERFRKRAEQLALHANVRSMFSSLLQSELIAYALASDLTGISQIAQAIEPLAARFPGWLGYKHLAEGFFELARGQLDAALAAFERGLAVSHPAARTTGLSCSAWPRLEGAAIEVLVSLGRAEEAKQRGERALSVCAEHEIEVAAFVVRRALGLAEAKLGDYAGASRRLEGVIADLTALGVTGLELGATYEARARIAVWAGDDEAIVTFGRHTAREYRYGEGSSLGARYERLMDEARTTGLSALPQLVDFQTKMTTVHTHAVSVASLVQHRLAGATTATERAEGALRLLCELSSARSGHLYLQTSSGLQRVASIGDSPAERMLDELAQRVLDDAVLGSAEATATATAVSSLLDSRSSVDTMRSGHRSVLLLGEVKDERRCAGVAMLVENDATATKVASEQLAAALATYLLRAGDARPA